MTLMATEKPAQATNSPVTIDDVKPGDQITCQGIEQGRPVIVVRLRDYSHDPRYVTVVYEHLVTRKSDLRTLLRDTPVSPQAATSVQSETATEPEPRRIPKTAHYERDCPVCGERLVYDRDREYAPMVGSFFHCGERVDIGRSLYGLDGTAIHNP